MSSRTKSEQGLLSSARAVGRSVLWVWDHSIGWVVRGMFLVLIVGYQRLISPLLPASCRYHPS
ncbi:MAG: membrane protein insertion efficiency factor YidD, partial [Actinomycetia bacterium]|nr:membrane protein insertion efficiency factor YidD [Actinomycetes bacterium]